MDSAGGDQEGGPASESLRQFKEDLGALVLEGRTLRAVESRTGISRGSVHNLFNLNRTVLPSQDHVGRVVRGYAATEDVQGWLDRFDRIMQLRREEDTRQGSKGEPPTIHEVASTDFTDEPDAPRSTRSKRLLLAGAILGTGGVIAMAFVALADQKQPSRSGDDAASYTNGMATDGDDPEIQRCTNDAIRLKSTKAGDVGFVSLVYSKECGAFWTRAERTDGQALNNHVMTTLVPPDLRDPQTADDPGAPITYTFILVQRGAFDGYCARADFYTDESKSSAEACYP